MQGTALHLKHCIVLREVFGIPCLVCVAVTGLKALNIIIELKKRCHVSKAFDSTYGLWELSILIPRELLYDLCASLHPSKEQG